MSEQTTYKGYTIELKEHQDKCSNYAFTISDPQGREIKNVPLGGEDKDSALGKAKEMIDFELEYAKE
ncbi:hypothetical protein [Desulfovermiculus halophilus]|jgi:hypothetical protein|uniref:hypothetical protein n=1 Tax=Desulfovermiculus halophilus TaxID=339722 RepID=UPI000482CFF7|nr:hypothetical protein [Desulfovermiculus halophilus]